MTTAILITPNADIIPINLSAPLHALLTTHLYLPTGDEETARALLAAATPSPDQATYEIGAHPVTGHGTAYELGTISLALWNLRCALAEGRLSEDEIHRHGITPHLIRQAHADAYAAARSAQSTRH